MTLAWITTWSRVCGIADYSKALWPEVQAALKRHGHEGTVVSLDEYPTRARLLARLRKLKPDLIHFQHEYGIWGGKNPPLYRFPRVVRAIREILPKARLTATAHTVLAPDYRYPTEGRGWEIPLRALANQTLAPRLNTLWGASTWGAVDGVIIHSDRQTSTIQAAHAPKVEVIPHFVANRLRGVPGTIARGSTFVAPELRTANEVLVFGFFTPEKGQDVAIEALARTKSNVRMILAGGTRRPRDEKYRDRCLARARELGVMDRLETTGYVDDRKIDALYKRAAVVLAPFRETSGSGSLAQALARGAAILASDLPLNREINEREPGALEFFRSEDPADCAAKLEALLANADARENLKAAAVRYAEACAPRVTAEKHVAFFEALQVR